MSRLLIRVVCFLSAGSCEKDNDNNNNSFTDLGNRAVIQRGTTDRQVYWVLFPEMS